MSPEHLLELARQHGVAEVYVSNSWSRAVFFEANRLKQIENTSSEGIALRLWQNNQPGLVVAYGDISPQTMVEKALAICAVNAPEEIYLATGSSFEPNQSLIPDLPPDLASGIVKESVKEITAPELISHGTEAIAQIIDLYPEVICGGGWDFSFQKMRLINSLGLDCSYDDYCVDGSLAAELVRDQDFLNISQSYSARQLFDHNLLTAPILQHLAWASQNAPTKNGKFPIIFTSKAADTLLETVSEAFNGRHLRQKTSPWLDKLNQLVVSELITLSQDPALGIHGMPFDDEGTPTKKVTWIEKGRLQGFYGDRRTAAELDLALTGNGWRGGLGSRPDPGLFNLIVNCGAGDLAHLISTISDGILIDQVLGDSADLAGDFSINVDLGYRIRQGQIVGRVKDTMVSGNVYSALNRVVGLGAERQWQGSLLTPPMIVEGLSVTS